MSGEKKTPPVRRVGSLIVVDGQAIPYERILNVVPVDEGAGAEIFIKGERENQVNYIPVAMPFEEVVEAIGWSEPNASSTLLYRGRPAVTREDFEAVERAFDAHEREMRAIEEKIRRVSLGLPPYQEKE